MPVPRTIGPHDCFRSCHEGNRFDTLAESTRRDWSSPRLLTISPTANTPTATTMKPMPSVNSKMPKLKRCVPVLTSVPTMPSSSPITTMAIDFTMSPCASTAAATRPISMREKDAGQHADQRADQHADEAIEKVLQRERDTEAEDQVVEEIHGFTRCR